MSEPNASPRLPACFEQHAAIVGRTGSGKSYVARGLVEGWLDARRRVCIVDPTDVWWGLRSNAAGDGPGHPVVIFGGEHADIAIGDQSGARLGEIIGSRNMPAVVVTAEMTGGERHRFLTDFLGELYRRNREPLHLVLDEADDAAPQNPLPENRRMLGEVDKIVRRGRVKGFRVLLITQRPAVLHKNVLTQASTMVAMRLPAPQDRKAVEEWIKGQADIDQARDVLSSLSRLQRGEGWVWAPDIGVLSRQAFPPIATFDSMRPPEHGETVQAPTTLAAVEREELAALLGAGVAISSPTNEGAKSNVAAAVDAAEKRGYERGYVAGMLAFEGKFNDEFAAAKQAIETAVGAAFADFASAITAKAVDRKAPPAQAIDATANRPQNPAKNIPQNIPDTLPPSAAKMLAVLARGMRLTWSQTATLAGLKARGGHFNAGRKALRDGGLIAEEGDVIAATPVGLAAAGGAKPKPETAAELLAWWRSVLPQTPGRILDQLSRQEGRWINKASLANSLSLQPRGGHWNAALSILRVNSLIEADDDKLRISAWLQEEVR